MAESITVSRTLAYAVAIIGSVSTLALGAGVSALWNQGQAIARMEAREEGRTQQMSSLEDAIKVAGSNRYTASDAASDRLAFFKALQSIQETLSLQIDSLRRESHEHERTISDLRVQLAQLEPKGHQ